MNEREVALNAIRKKLVGKTLNYKEIYSVIDQITKNKLGDILTTYFAASGYTKGFTNEELYFLTYAMVETGERLRFTGIVADKHSVGGVPGNRTTLIVVPIVAAAGFTIPKSSSRAITTPSGTADDMEILSPVNLTSKRIYEVVKKTNGCIVWGGSVNIAPADDVIIKVEKPLLFESFDKIIVSIMAKKIAFGSNHVVIDLPYGKTAKIHRLSDAKKLKEKFEYVAKKFGIKIRFLINKTDQPEGRGIGPILGVRDALRVLQQKRNRPLGLEKRSIMLSATLLDLCLESAAKKREYIRKKYGSCLGWATKILKDGTAFKKMQEIILAQGGNPNIDSEYLKPGKFSFQLTSPRNVIIKSINSKNLTIIAKILGAPEQKGAGIYLEKMIGEKAQKGEAVCTLYSQSGHNLSESKKNISHFPIFTYS